MLRLSIPSLLFSALALQVNAQDDPPRLTGQHFKITVIENLDFLVKVDNEVDGNPGIEDLSGYMLDMIEQVSKPYRADFTYEIFLPSGHGAQCNPQLGSADDVDGVEYAQRYRPQFNCGQDDVVEERADDLAKTDMYWSLYYVTPTRQLLNQFTIPYQPPPAGALTMYGTATFVKDMDDLIQQQKEGKQKPACVGESTAYNLYLQKAFPDLQLYDTPNNNAGFYQALVDGHCDVVINAYPYATDFIAERYDNGECMINGNPVGVVGEKLGFGLNQFAVGVGRHLPPNVTETLSYWMNILMTCAPDDPESACPAANGGGLETHYSAYARGDPGVCGYVNEPIDSNKLSSGAIAGIVVGCALFVALIVGYQFMANKIKEKEQEERYKRNFVAHIAKSLKIGQTPGTLTADELAKEFEKISEEHQHGITKDALKAWLSDDKVGALSDSDFEALWSALDADGSGLVDVIEFCTFLASCGEAFEEEYEKQKKMSKWDKIKHASQRFSATSTTSKPVVAEDPSKLAPQSEVSENQESDEA